MSTTAEQRDYLGQCMDFGLVIRTDGTGAARVSDTLGIHGPEEIQYVDVDADGGAPDPVAPDGWEYLTGFTGQYAYSGPVMHESEFIGGRLADHILTTPGHYAAVEVDGWTPERVNHDCPFPADCDEEAVVVGWAILHYVGMTPELGTDTL